MYAENEAYKQERTGMLELSGINYWAVVVVWLVNVTVGIYWYSPAGFGKKWKKYTGIDIMKMAENEASKILVAVAVSAAVLAFTLAVTLNSFQVGSLATALGASVVLWLGFTAATTVGNSLYTRFGWGFWWLNSSYYLLVIAIGSVILTMW